MFNVTFYISVIGETEGESSDILSDIATNAKCPTKFALCHQRSYLNHCIYLEKKILI